jgi:hypothetical protein
VCGMSVTRISTVASASPQQLRRPWQPQRTVIAQDSQPDADNGSNVVPPPTAYTMEADGRLDL